MTEIVHAESFSPTTENQSGEQPAPGRALVPYDASFAAKSVTADTSTKGRKRVSTRKPTPRNKKTKVFGDPLAVVLDRLARELGELTEGFADSLDGWRAVGRTANALARLVEEINEETRPQPPLTVQRQIEDRFGRETYSSVRRAMRLVAPERKATNRRPFTLPGAETAWPKAVAWAKTQGRLLPTSLGAADALLRDFNEATVKGYREWLDAQRAQRKERATTSKHEHLTEEFVRKHLRDHQQAINEALRALDQGQPADAVALARDLLRSALNAYDHDRQAFVASIT